MTVGARVYDGSGNITFETPDAVAGVCVGVLELDATDTDTLDFPDFTGRTLYAVTLTGSALTTDGLTITYPSGVPTIAIGTDTAARVIALFIE